jgi:hypothetical protein
MMWLGAALLWPAALAAQPLAFLSVIDDVPLMAGLQEVPDSAVVFDKPEGRIVEVQAAGTLDMVAVASFYRQALPQFGWNPDPAAKESSTRRLIRLTFVRDSERLTVEVERAEGKTAASFALAPR